MNDNKSTWTIETQAIGKIGRILDGLSEEAREHVWRFVDGHEQETFRAIHEMMVEAINDKVAAGNAELARIREEIAEAAKRDKP